MMKLGISLIGLLFCFSFNGVFSHQCNTDSTCSVEIVFVMDSSGSVTLSGWNEEVAFVQGVIAGVGGHSHFGVIEFASDESTIYDLCADQSDCEAITDEIDGFPYAGGGTNIPLGVQAGVDMLTTCGDNPDELNNVMVVITDGFGGDPCYLKADLDNLNTKVFLVKVGSGISNTAIDCLVDDTTTDIFTSSSFGDIDLLVDQLTVSACEGECDLELGECDNDPCSCAELTNCNICHSNGCDECESGYFKVDYDHKCISCADTFGEGCLFCQDFNGCGQCADGYQRELIDDCGLYGCVADGSIVAEECDQCFVLAIDESGSISDSEFDMEQAFAHDVIDLLDEDSDLGVVAFGSDSRVIFALNSGTNQQAKDAITAMVQAKSGTDYIDAIDEALGQFASCDPDKPPVFLLISDGQPNQDPCSKKTDLDAAGVTTIIVGIGSGFNAASTQITCLVDDTNNIFEVDDFTEEAFAAIIDDLKDALCQGVCPNGATDSSLDIDEAGCSIPCENSPCSCSELCFCDVCHVNGCNQCQDGYFKKDYNHPCIQCQEMFGDGCMFCQDFDGCGQCASGYQRVYNSECGLYECQ